jgi:hypothetical protein
MRFAIVITAGVLAASVAASTTSLAATKQKAQAARAQASAMSVNECINLAIERGYARSDLDTGGSRTNPARRFVMNCLQGRQR